MKKLIFSSFLLTCVNTPLVHAQTNQAQTTVDLPDMVVTATRSELPKNQLATATTVYTRKDIERLQVKTFPDLLRGTTGIDMTQQGGDGKITSVFMRGTNSNHLLVLVDGIKIGSTTTGTSPFEFIPIDQIERVEIIRGPQSSLYGSEAIGGVIQIFTRKGGHSDKPNYSLDAGAGSYDTYRAAGQVSGKWKSSWYSLGASSLGSAGINARQNDNPDRDGYHNTAMNARVGYRFDNNAELEAFYMRAEGNTEIDGGFHKTDFKNQVVGFSGAMDVSGNWRSTLRLGQSRDENNNFADISLYDSRFDSTRWNASWLNELHLSDNHQLVLGSDYRLDEVDSTVTFVKNERYDVGVFGELHSRIFDNHFINASLRWDENQAFGNYVTGNFGWRYNWGTGISTFASFGNAFKAPTLNDLYYKDEFGSHGDANLKPEESTSFEAGFSGTHDWAKWELRGYHTNIDNLITWFTDPNTYISIPIQTQKAQIDGIEAEISTQLLGWNNKLGMQILKPLDRETNLRLPRRADKILTYDLSRSWGQLDIGGNVIARHNSFEEDWLGKRTEVAGFVTVDLRAAYHLNKNWMFSAKLNNLLDKDYQTVYQYNTQGRNFFLSIHYNN